MENIVINKTNTTQEATNHKITITNRNNISISGITKMCSSNETSITMLIKNVRLVVNGKDLHIEKLDVENGLLEASGTIDSAKYTGNDGFIKRIFK